MHTSLEIAERRAMSDSVSPSPRRRRKEERPSELIAAARAGVSKGTLYLYFESKEALFKAVIEDAIVPLLAAAEDEIASYQGDSVDLLRRLLFGWWEQIGATRLAGVPKLLIAEARNFPEVAQYYHDAVIARARGEFRPLDLETVIDVIYAPLMMLVVWRSSMCFCAKETDPADYLKTHFDLLVQGLCQQKGLA